MYAFARHKSSEGQPTFADLEETIGKHKTVKNATMITDGASAFGSFVKKHPELRIDHHYISHGTSALKKTGFSRTEVVVTIQKAQ